MEHPFIEDIDNLISQILYSLKKNLVNKTVEINSGQEMKDFLHILFNI